MELALKRAIASPASQPRPKLNTTRQRRKLNPVSQPVWREVRYLTTVYIGHVSGHVTQLVCVCNQTGVGQVKTVNNFSSECHETCVVEPREKLCCRKWLGPVFKGPCVFLVLGVNRILCRDKQTSIFRPHIGILFSTFLCHLPPTNIVWHVSIMRIIYWPLHPNLSLNYQFERLM